MNRDIQAGKSRISLAGPETRAQINTGPSFAFIIEWDNARLSELGRARQMLKALQEQVVHHRPLPARPPQIVILYDKNRVDPAIIHQTVAEMIDASAWQASIELLPTDGLGYYELKNFGVPHTDREIVLFIDSDTIPEPGWFDALMSAIEQPHIDVAGGSTFVAPDSFVAKAFNLFWFFERRSKGASLRPHNYFYANNVAFKRSVLERYPYPDLESFRGQCHVMCGRLREDGFTIYRHDGARMMHPTTNGIGHFFRRAICEGHDEVTIHRAKKMGRLLTGPFGSLARLMRRLKSMAGGAMRNRRDVDLSVFGAIAAMGLGTVYCMLKFFGEIVTYYNPTFVRRHWPI
jgi:hypothetical protein